MTGAPALRRPSPRQHAALGAALFRGQAAIDAWHVLQQYSNHLDQTDRSTFRLLPMTYRNLRDAGLAEAELLTLKGIYRQAWYRNRVVIAYAHRTIAILREAGIEPLALKGLGLVGTAYDGVALRPMDDIDLLIRPEEHTAASDALIRAGWKPTRGTVNRYFRRARVFHGMPLVGKEEIEVDLHSAMLEENISPGIDAPLYERAVENVLDGMTVRTLSLEDHVLNACVHGARWDWGLPLRWIVDVSTIARRSEAIDWEEILYESHRRGVALPVAAGLALVAEYCEAIPPAVVARAASSRASRFERWNFAAQQADDSLYANTARTVGRYLQMAARRPIQTQIRDFPVYLEWIWELESPGGIPGDAFRRVKARIRPAK